MKKYKLLIAEEFALCVLPVTLQWSRHPELSLVQVVIGTCIYAAGILVAYFCCAFRLRGGRRSNSVWIMDVLFYFALVLIFSGSLKGLSNFISNPMDTIELLKLSTLCAFLFLLVNVIFVTGIGIITEDNA